MRSALTFFVIQNSPMLFATVRPRKVTKLWIWVGRLWSNQIEPVLTPTKVQPNFCIQGLDALQADFVSSKGHEDFLR
jgi:hypothetical protein